MIINGTVENRRMQYLSQQQQKEKWYRNSHSRTRSSLLVLISYLYSSGNVCCTKWCGYGKVVLPFYPLPQEWISRCKTEILCKRRLHTVWATPATWSIYGYFPESLKSILVVTPHNVEQTLSLGLISIDISNRNLRIGIPSGNQGWVVARNF